MKISIIAAIGKNRELGAGNKLIWHISSDLKRLKELTTGHPIIMGRKTYESIGRLLPNRTNIIITRDANYKVEGAIVVHSLDKAFASAKESVGSDEIFIFGGAQIFEQAIGEADRLYLTLIDAENKNADAFFPKYSEFKKVIKQENGEENGLKFEYLTLER
ncbi:MAG: diacylglycerol kinase [Candidatus Levybacteria bacterium RIFCSPHIGHO2_01_FULL_40_10]|nr:MAG: diacylglycerol kinase [Candidatus Levybacteria bacterium RIFCSPHIGHO2_01_FULL_40_10]